MDVDGELAEGTLKDADILPQPAVINPENLPDPPPEGEHCIDRRFEPNDDIPVNNVDSLGRSAEKGLIYINVHTSANLGGEVRGQILEKVY